MAPVRQPALAAGRHGRSGTGLWSSGMGLQSSSIGFRTGASAPSGTVQPARTQSAPGRPA
eukprot:532902-Alexandrium_andersonii.AAC.1